MKSRISSIQYCLMLFLLLWICANSWSAEDGITALQKQISVLEEQKGQLETEKQTLIAEGDKLSYKIEDLKMQAKSGLGIIGRYRLSRNLRKAQALSAKTQILEKKIYEIESALKSKRSDLKREYEHQIAVLLEKLNGVGKAEESKEILEKVKEYQAAKEQLTKPEKEEPEHLDITKIEIEEYDGPQEIREKADLIKDFANKLNDRIDMVNTRIERLKEESKTRKKLGEFAEEISFFGERISKEEIASDSGREPARESIEEPTKEESVAVEISTLTRGTSDMELPTEDPPAIAVTEPSAPSSKIVIEHNGVSADFMGISLDQFEKEIKLLEKQKQDLKKEISTLSEKASSFYKKADEIEKSEIRTKEE